MSSEENFKKGAAEAIVGFLNANVAKSGLSNIDKELKKDFVLAKKRSKDQKRRASKKKVRCLTRAEKKELGFYAIPRKGVQYKEVLPLNKIWLQYISEVLELDNSIPDPTSKAWENFTQTLYRADFHGSFLKVTRSKCPSLVDKSGICIMDTRNTFKIVSENNITSTIPKRDCVFQMDLNKCKITLFGKLLCVRPAERSTKKIKGHIHPDL
ncbi:ribonuclease P protein subunit p29 [Trichoplusia ni]|uniref:Ribonuclease P protein subunit p29 n=1 Tax=Trichoplusia ni TaxID=7111 RepID=A0A7E5WI68_TRINI|nr:ribonuclease P protein subunit p29 [Trichoplusia ni]